MMKPIVTWVLVANTRKVSVVENRGPGRGLDVLPELQMQSTRAGLPRDKAGLGHSIGGHGVAAVEQADPQARTDAEFAREVARRMSSALVARRFDRLIVTAGPEMLGLLRDAFDDVVRAVVIGEVAKDLSNQNAKVLASHIADFIVV